MVLYHIPQMARCTKHDKIFCVVCEACPECAAEKAKIKLKGRSVYYVPPKKVKVGVE